MLSDNLSRRRLLSAVLCTAAAGAITHRGIDAACAAEMPAVKITPNDAAPDYESIEGFALPDSEPIEITSIVDRRGAFGTKLFPGIEDRPEALALLPGGSSPNVVKTFLLRTKMRTVMVDTGWGDQNGLTFGTLEKLGVKREAVTDILFTHLDGDHVTGLAHDGKAAFPNATIHLSEAEYDAWIVKGIGRAEKSIANAKAMFSFYEGRIKTFAFGEAPLSDMPNLKARDLRGHTMGHTGFEIEGEKRLMIAGDFLHAVPLQLRFPDISSTYDADLKAAADIRRALLEDYAQKGGLLAGMHYAAVAGIKKDPAGGYMFG